MSTCGTNYVYFERVCVGALFIWNRAGSRGLLGFNFVHTILLFGIWGKHISIFIFQFSWARGGEGEPDISRLVLPQNDVRTGK